MHISPDREDRAKQKARRIFMKELVQFNDITKTTYNPIMKNWKEGGGKIIGYSCTYVPEEIIVAAGMMPFRMRAPESNNTYECEKYMTNQTCSFCRHVVDEVLKGKYDFLDGYVGVNGCDQMKRVGDIIRAGAFKKAIAEKKFFFEFIGAPRVTCNDDSEKYYKEEITRLKEKLEGHFGLEITEQRLRESIGKVNESRRLLRELYDLRKEKNPPVTGAETLSIAVAYASLPKEVFNKDLKALLSKLDGRVAMPAYRKRLFLYGSELDDPEYVKIIEDQGALIVADGICFGARMFWDLVNESLDPMEALAKRYYSRWSCPRMMDPHRRQDRIKEIVRDWNIDGIVGERLIFCQVFGTERAITNLETKKSGFPTLWLEREYLLGGIGQMKTRVQAFLESMD
jgi:benzoyl-CoA reductase subunit C